MAAQYDGAKGLFASLFDFNFTSFITLKFLKVIYAIVMALIFLGGVIFFFGGLLSGRAAGVLAALFIVPILVLLQLILLRVYLESLALFFRVGENTQAIRQSLGGSGGPSAGGFGDYPQPPVPPTPPPASPQAPSGAVPSWAQPQQPSAAPAQPPAEPPQAPPQQPGFPPPGS
jgi:hypothetical protein